MRGISWLAEDLSASQDGLYFMLLGNPADTYLYRTI